MNKEIIFTDEAPKAIGPYSQAVKAGTFLFISGQIAIDPATGNFLAESSVKEQTHRIMKNLSAILKAKNLDFSAVVKTTIYLTELTDFSIVNEIYASYFATKDYPARATVAVKALPREALVEIEMIAYIS
jgi:2-iminobutanoate/2-iminopropanoate deaminase